MTYKHRLTYKTERRKNNNTPNKTHITDYSSRNGVRHASASKWARGKPLEKTVKKREQIIIIIIFCNKIDRGSEIESNESESLYKIENLVSSSIVGRSFCII